MFSTKKLARLAVISALYIVLSLITFPVASGAVQVRVAESLTLLPLIFPESVFGITVGCLLTNLITGCPVFDIAIGSLITFVSGLMTYFVGRLIKKTPLKILTGGLFPVLFNALLLPLIWYYAYGEQKYAYIVSTLLVLAGQTVSVYGLGTFLFVNVKRLKEKGLPFFNG